MNESDIISSRRKFLKNMAYGSLLMIGGIKVVNAKAKPIASHIVLDPHSASPTKTRVHDTLHQHLSSQKIDAHHTPVHDTPHSNLASHNKDTRKTAAHDASHQRLASNKIDTRKTSIHDESHQRLAANKTAPHKEAPVHDESHQHLASNKIDTHTKLGRNSPSHKVLAFRNAHTGDQLKLTYFERGRYINDALDEINHLLRDYHDGTVHPIDRALLDQLYDLKHALEIKKPFHIVSAYRSPATNADLRKHSDGVAKNSLHMEGRAIDIRIEGLDSRRIRDAALAMQRGGVGYYERSDFVHLDTGSIRTWTG